MVMKIFSLFLKRNKCESKKIINDFSLLNEYKIVAKCITGPDIEYMYNSRKEIPGLCPKCGSRLKMIPNLYYHVPEKKGDIFYTYDGYCIVSQKFKRFCEERQYEKLKFQKLETGNYYYFEPLGIFKTYIYKNPINKLGEFCEFCKTYSWICGPALKDKDFVLSSDDFILRTDSYRGCNEEKNPMIIVGLRTEKEMKNYGLTGICFSNVYG